MLQKDFNPTIRFMVVSDIHYDDEKCIEEERMAKAIKIAYRLADEHPSYKKLDAVFVNGDFANSGSRIQMEKFKATLDNNLQPGTRYMLDMASHEFRANGVDGAYELFTEIFGIPADNHIKINGFDFISVSASHGCEFDDDKLDFARTELKKARNSDPQKPIFFFQHPHLTDTVSGSIYWGDESFIPILMDYPQVVDFSGHSHVPINDPRSVYQNHFTCFGTGSMSYFELDEFDKHYGTHPPKNEDCAQMLLVEANGEGAVRVYPYDVLTDNFFPYVWEIDEPWNPDSFKYTDARYKTTDAPYFENAKISFSDITADSFCVTFDQAKVKTDYVNDYKIVVKETESGLIVKQKKIWSDFYFYNMPETLGVCVDNLEHGTEYTVEIIAGSFWNTYSAPLKGAVKTDNN